MIVFEAATKGTSDYVMLALGFDIDWTNSIRLMLDWSLQFLWSWLSSETQNNLSWCVFN